jgi:hypothetical protein
MPEPELGDELGDGPEIELTAYLKTNVSADFPALVREAAVRAGFKNSSDWVRQRLIEALVDEIGAEYEPLLARQPHWGNGKGATSPEYIAKRYGRPWPPETAGSGSKSSEKVSQDG